jgi:hypothetical protein
MLALIVSAWLLWYRLGLDIAPMDGAALQALVARLYAMPPHIIARAKQSLIFKPQR